MKKTIFLLSFSLLFIGCNKNELSQADVQKSTVEKPLTNLELIKDNLEVYLESEEYSARLNELYWCSEESGGYSNFQYVDKGYYLNPYYTSSTMVKFSDLQSLLTYRYNNPNAEGDSQYVDISFEILGADGDFLSTIEANRVYNEFICRLRDQLNLSLDAQRIEYSLNFTLDYYLCCMGGSCCNPIFSAYGNAYL